MEAIHEHAPSPDALSESRAQDLKRKYVPRATQACWVCKTKKIKCDEGRPACSSCRDRNRICTYVESGPKKRSKDSSSNKATQDLGLNMAEGSNTVRRNNATLPPVERSHGGSEYPVSPATNREPSARAESIGSENAIQPQAVAFAAATTPIFQQKDSPAGLDTVGGLNKHTHGREFYGTSSNLALLSQLISKARSRIAAPSTACPRLPFSTQNGEVDASSWSKIQERSQAGVSEQPGSDTQSGTRKILKDNRLSLVNLLFDEDSAMQDSTQIDGTKTPTIRVGGHAGGTAHQSPREASLQLEAPDVNQSDRVQFNGHAARLEPGNGRSSTLLDRRWVELQLEKEYMRIFFDNLHYIHPFLSHSAFVAQCERDVWKYTDRQNFRKHQSHFLALYNAVIAVGALTAGVDVLETFRSSLAKQHSRQDSTNGMLTPSSINLSKIYFARAKKSLGDYFEVCSLEGVQALILMSLYSQNALKPHACYMYSGMAVRSALAIGLPDEYSTDPTLASDEAKRTWWAVYSQEVDMCCSSGRRSSLIEPDQYRMPLPEGKPDGGVSSIDMIPQMVQFASILLRTSLMLYHNAKDVPGLEKSRIACELDRDLSLWRTNLPSWLNSGSHPFTEPEWAGKQRLVLELRFHNAKILIHRPLMASSDAQNSSEFELHTAACLEGARKTIELLYEAYTHRHYFRTWYYNSTYILYASMLVLYVVLINYPHASSEALIQDVEKSLDILQAMDHVKVAKRCANLIREVLEVVKRQNTNIQDAHNDGEEVAGFQTHPTYGHRSHNYSNFTDIGWNAANLPSELNANMQTNSQVPSNFNVAAGTTRNSLLASLMDPVALEEFASDANIDRASTLSSDWNALESGMWMDFDMSHNFFGGN